MTKDILPMQIYKGIMTSRFAYTARKLMQKGGSKLYRLQLKAFKHNRNVLISDFDLLESMGTKFKNIKELLSHLEKDPQPKFWVQFDQRLETISTLIRHFPNAEQEILSDADKICNHFFDLLGSNPVYLGEKINWHLDFKSNHIFDNQKLYFEIKPANFPGGFDIKVPWELSRFQHAIRLGQAYWLQLDEKYALEFKSEIEDWIISNPYPYGVNWSCTMDVAIRVVNWLWSYAFFRQSPSLDPSFHTMFYKSAFTHARHILNNLEWYRKLTTNHYLANLVGLIYCGLLLPEFKESQKWFLFGVNELEIEMAKQTYADGMDFEASTSYHRLSTELFLSATLLVELHGHKFSDDYIDRLEKMIDNIGVISRPDGTAPMFGDQDNGRLHRLKTWPSPEREWQDFRHILAIGSVWKDNCKWASASLDCFDEAVWFFGSGINNLYSKGKSNQFIEEERSIALKDSGLYILKNEDFHISVDTGSLGQNGVGGHAHDDSLSFDLYCCGHSWIVDPGTYLYTQDFHARNNFRAAEVHNSVTIDELNNNSFNPLNLFEMESNKETSVLLWESNSQSSLLIGKSLYANPNKLSHVRTFLLDNDSDLFIVYDSVTGVPGTRRMKLHFSSEVVSINSLPDYHGLEIIHHDKKRIWLISSANTLKNIIQEKSSISPSYGVIAPCLSAVFEWSEDDSHTLVVISENNIAKYPKLIGKIQSLREICFQK